jgi:hypothetical protein
VTATDREWFEEEEYWERFAPIMFDSARWAEFPPWRTASRASRE